MLSTSFLLVFTAFSGVQNLESSLSLPHGVSGSTSLGIIYSVFCVCSFVSPSIVRVLTPKVCIMIQMCCLGIYVGSTWYPRPYTLYVAATLTGMFAGPLWVSQGVLVARFAAHLGPGNPTQHVGKVQGVFYAIFQMTQLTGNLISSLALHGHDVTSKTARMLFSVYLGCVATALLFVGLFLRTDPPRAEKLHTQQQEPLLSVDDLPPGASNK